MPKEAKFDVAGLAPESAEPVFHQPLKTAKKKGNWVVIVLVAVIIIAAVLFYLDASGKVNLFGKKEPGQINFDASNWRAVFLTNGQVYFGHLKNADADYPELADIYYLQVQEVPIQPAEPATNEEGVQPAGTTQQQLILVKFGTELHKPQDKMLINKDHIMFYEDLAADSPVVKSIEDYLKAEAAKAVK
jgi:hypothetical protein